MDLSKVVNDQFKNIISDGYIENLIKHELEKTIKEIIHDLLREWSDFGKDLKETIKEKININLKELDIPEYNTLILQAISQQIDETISSNGLIDIKKLSHEMLFSPQKEVKLSELVNKFRKDFEEEACENDWCEFTCIMEDSGSCDGYYNVYLDSYEDTSKYACQYQIRINENGIWYAKDTKLDKYEEKVKWKLENLHSFKNYLHGLYAHGTKIIKDEDNIDTYYGCCED